MAKVGDKELHESWGMVSSGLRRRVGDGEHPRGDLRRHDAQGDLRHDRAANDGALLRRLGVHRGGRRRPGSPPNAATPRACPWEATCTALPTAGLRAFLVGALKDPISGNLDRIQIVKVWMDGTGQAETHEKVYDVAWSGDRKPGSDGKLPAGGQHRDVANAYLDQHDRHSPS